MIALDTNVLVYAHQARSASHEPAVLALESLASAGEAWALPWPAAHEFVKVMTSMHRERVPLTDALQMLANVADAPGCRMIGEAPGHLRRVTELALAAEASSAVFYDARIAAVCLGHGVREIWTADRDFSRFPGLRARNPITEPPLG